MTHTVFTTPTGILNGLHNSLLTQSHLLIAGASGSGKSVLVNGLITNALHYLPFAKPGCKQFILIDPKRVELAPYRNLPHTIRYACEPDDMISALQAAVAITESRYRLMEEQGILKYNGSDIYVVIEELADLMTTNRKTVQPLIQRLSQIARAARVHIIAVTQCPLVKVIPTEIKVNFDGIVALRTRSAQDSRNIIGITGAELLPRYGECLYYTPDIVGIFRYDVPFVTDDEKEKLIDFWMRQVEEQKPKGFFARLFER